MLRLQGAGRQQPQAALVQLALRRAGAQHPRLPCQPRALAALPLLSHPAASGTAHQPAPLATPHGRRAAYSPRCCCGSPSRSHPIGFAGRGAFRPSLRCAATSGGSGDSSRDSSRGRGRGGLADEEAHKQSSSLFGYQQLVTTTTTFKERALAYARDTLLVAYTALVENTFIALLERLRADRLLRAATPLLENGYATLTGTWHRTADRRRFAYSLVNNTSPGFAVPAQYRATDFPFSAPPPRGGPGPGPGPGPSPFRPQPVVEEDREGAGGARDTNVHEGGRRLEGSEGAESGKGGARGESSRRGGGYDLRRLHFLALCQKLVYERPEVIQDVAERWGWRLAHYFNTGDKEVPAPGPEARELGAASRTTFVPRTRAAILQGDQATILIFRGSEPTNLINMRSNSQISMTLRPRMGRVHDGFYSALFYRDQDSTSSLYDRLLAALADADPAGARPLYVTGHSLGAALALIFAQALAARRSAPPGAPKPAVSVKVHASSTAAEPRAPQAPQGEATPRGEGREEARLEVAEVVGFGAPRCGDAEWARLLAERLPARVFCIHHGSDIIPYVPPKWLDYAGAGTEVFLTSTGRLLDAAAAPAATRAAHQRELWLFLPFWALKLGRGLLDPEEGKLRTVYRIVLLFLLPGILDHFPSTYERELRRQLADRE